MGNVIEKVKYYFRPADEVAYQEIHILPENVHMYFDDDELSADDEWEIPSFMNKENKNESNISD